MALTSDVTGRRGRAVLPLGCMIWPGLLAIGLLVAGAMAMSDWDTLSGFAKAGAVVLIVIGTLLLLPVVFMAGFQITMWRFFRQLSDIEKDGHIRVRKVYRAGGGLRDTNEPADDRIIDAPKSPDAKDRP